MHRFLAALSIAALLCALKACTPSAPPPETPQPAPPVPLAEVVTDLPDHPDKNLVMANCLPCHSLAYIVNQPPMKREAWKKTVRKMIDAYGAPVPDSVIAERITDYLFSIRKGE